MPRMLCFFVALLISSVCTAQRPNVILVITDDQGYGDIGAHGNETIHTPHLDRLHAQSVRLTDFHADPTCSPTRAALMSGRYSTRTGVWHTIMGRSIMATTELTLAEVFKANGYRTAAFGKWHLGDNAPCRPQDQGFEHTLIHGGGGVGQTPDYFGNDYFDDTYWLNGRPKKYEGYCTDVWFDGALSFIDKHKGGDAPFFVYLSTNAPHGPFNVAEKYERFYRDRGVKGATAPFWGMITNIDENMGRLMGMLDEWRLADDTILIFMTDNGTAAGTFNAGMKGKKGSEYDGGHRVPFFIRWPNGRLGAPTGKAQGATGGYDRDVLAAHIDVLPTLADLCKLKKPDGPAIDGISLAGFLYPNVAAKVPERAVFVHSQRIEHPQQWRKSAVMTERWRLVNGKELFDIGADPGQQKNVAAEHGDVVEKLRGEYEKWWQSLTPVFDDYVRIGLGGDENPARLTCHDWHTDDGPVPWHQNAVRSGQMANGFWAVNVERDGRYKFTLRRWDVGVDKPIEATAARMKIGDVDAKANINERQSQAQFTVDLKKGAAKLETWLTQGEKSRGAYYVYVRRLD